MVTFSSYPADPRPRRAIDALLKQDMYVDLICLADPKEPLRAKNQGLDILRVPISHRRKGKFSYIFNYLAFIIICAAVQALRTVTRRYDLVYVHNMPDILVISSLVPKVFGAKVILDMHDPMPELMRTIYNQGTNGLGVQLLIRLEKWSMAWADLVITVNVACKRIFASRSCRAEKIGVVMNSPDEEIFSPQPTTQRLSYDQQQSQFVIMYHGSLVERNGLDLAIDTLARLRNVVPRVQLKVYGRETSFLDRIMREARDKGLGDCVHYLGPKSLEDLVPEIEHCDVGIIPNHRNAFTEINTPTRIFEYLALGKPVIAPRTPGICDYFDDQSMVFFEPGNIEDLADKAAYVFAHGREIAEIVRRGQEIHRAHSWSNESRRFVELVTDLLNEKSSKLGSLGGGRGTLLTSVMASSEMSHEHAESSR